MAKWCALVFLFAVSWVTAYPGAQEVAFPEDVRDSSSRIVSGWEATEGQFPYQLSIRMITTAGTVVSCGATLIDNEWALTAAHCTGNRVTIVVRVGLIAISRPALIFETTDYYNHPLYIETLPFVQTNDIGLIKFNRFVKYTDIIKPIRIQSSLDKDKNYSGERLIASGWGRTWTDGTAPEVLNWVFLTGESNEACRNAYSGSNIIVASTICASAYNVSSQSTCQGDSGGPLLTVDVDGELTQVGISSFVSGTGCHTPFPAGFCRPGHYHDWIEEVTGKSFDWDPSALPTTTLAPEEESPEEGEESSEEGEESSEEGEESSEEDEEEEEEDEVEEEEEEEEEQEA